MTSIYTICISQVYTKRFVNLLFAKSIFKGFYKHFSLKVNIKNALYIFCLLVEYSNDFVNALYFKSKYVQSPL